MHGTLIAAAFGLGLVGAVATTPAFAAHVDSSGMMTQPGPMMGTGMLMPQMDSARGHHLFASKGCVVCHSINGVGGEDAPALDASGMSMPMSPFEFAARMWRGAGAMIMMQEEELGAQIELTGQDLADIIAFVHDEGEQKHFTDADIPENIRALMIEDEGSAEDQQGEAKSSD